MDSPADQPADLDTQRQSVVDRLHSVGLLKGSKAIDRIAALAARTLGVPAAGLGIAHLDAVYWLSWAGPGVHTWQHPESVSGLTCACEVRCTCVGGSR